MTDRDPDRLRRRRLPRHARPAGPPGRRAGRRCGAGGLEDRLQHAGHPGALRADRPRRRLPDRRRGVARRRPPCRWPAGARRPSRSRSRSGSGTDGARRRAGARPRAGRPRHLLRRHRAGPRRQHLPARGDLRGRGPGGRPVGRRRRRDEGRRASWPRAASWRTRPRRSPSSRPYLAAHGAALEPGQRIIAGSVVAPVAVAPGDELTCRSGRSATCRSASPDADGDARVWLVPDQAGRPTQRFGSQHRRAVPPVAVPVEQPEAQVVAEQPLVVVDPRPVEEAHARRRREQAPRLTTLRPLARGSRPAVHRRPCRCRIQPPAVGVPGSSSCSRRSTRSRPSAAMV